VGPSKPTICRILRRHGLNRLESLTPAEPVVHYEREHPGDLLHFDIKKLGRIEVVGHRIAGNRHIRRKGAGWEYLHVVIDDHSRVALAALLPSEGYVSALRILEAALAFYANLGVTVQRLMTDNGGCYRAKPFKQACVEKDLRHIYTRPYRPKSNGKAERFILTLCREWAYAQAYGHSNERHAHLLPWLHRYNWHRPHTALKNKLPISRLPNSMRFGRVPRFGVLVELIPFSKGIET
jgi:transposase InsO family protein